MNDRAFIDTNVLIYAIGNQEGRQQAATKVLFSDMELVISSQVINEFISICLKKKLLTGEQIELFAHEFMAMFEFSLIHDHTIRKALALQKTYAYSYWDSLILATALETQCSFLYSEDMQHGQLIDQELKICNPFFKE